MSEKYVGFILSACAGLIQQLVSVGDRFSLRDIDGGVPTGDYEITHIRVDTHYNCSFVNNTQIPFKRVYFGVDMDGRTAYTRDVNCIVRSMSDA